MRKDFENAQILWDASCEEVFQHVVFSKKHSKRKLKQLFDDLCEAKKLEARAIAGDQEAEKEFVRMMKTFYKRIQDWKNSTPDDEQSVQKEN